MLEQKWQAIGLAQLERRVRESGREYQYDHTEGGTLPRNHQWRPYRFCVQDAVLGLTVVRHSRRLNCLLVDVFLAADIPEYEPGSGAIALAAFLLSEAYRCGGTMEVRFTEYVEDQRVPAALRDLAQELDVRLEHTDDGLLTPMEARRLYMALTGFSPPLRAHIEALEQAGWLSSAQACYAVHHGVWTTSELEAILLSSRRPGSLLSGDVLPEQRHLYLHDLLQGRAALLGGYLDRKLAQREHEVEPDRVVELEDDERPVAIEFDADAYIKTYHCDQESMPVPWIADPEVPEITLDPGQPLTVLIRARDDADMRAHLGQDLEAAVELSKKRWAEANAGPVCILLPRDFQKLPDDQRAFFLRQAREKQVIVLECPEFVWVLDSEVERRLRNVRIMRA